LGERKRKMKLKVVLHAGDPPHQRCRAEVPVLPGCVSEGDSPEEALANIRNAVASYFDPPRGDADRVEEIELLLRYEEPVDTSRDEPEASETQGPQLSALHRFRMEHGRHETAALIALMVGLFAALACGALALAPIWLGFVIGYLTTAGFAALVCTVDL
jgi:predicted RNase H-like HicB family nuclease